MAKVFFVFRNVAVGVAAVGPATAFYTLLRGVSVLSVSQLRELCAGVWPFRTVTIRSRPSPLFPSVVEGSKVTGHAGCTFAARTLV